MNKMVLAGIIVAAAAAGIVGVVALPEPAQPQARDDGAKPLVMSSFGTIHEFVQEVGGDRIDAVLLVPAGVSPHDWEPTAREVQELYASDLVVLNGAGFEEWAEGLEDSEYGGTVVHTSDGIDLIQLGDEHTDEHMDEARDEHTDEHMDEARDEHTDEHMDEAKDEHMDEHTDEHMDEAKDEHMDEAKEEHMDEHTDEHMDEAKDEHMDEHTDEHAEEDGHGHAHTSGLDPHIWLSPPKAIIQVTNIADALIELDPEGEQEYRERAAAYVAELEALDSRIRAGLEGCSRDFVAFHNAFSYFADEYGLVQHTVVQSLDPHADVTAGALEEIIVTARDLGLDTVYTEASADEGALSAVAAELGASILVLSPLEVTDDPYIEAMDQNLENLRSGLCTP